MKDFDVLVKTDGDATVVYLSGDLDIATAPILTEALTSVSGHVVFDCARLTFLGSSGLDIISRWSRKGGASLRNLNGEPLRAVEMRTELNALCE